MSHPHDRLRPNADEVVSKVMDGEAIVIRLSDGVYYSLDRAGGLVWELIEAETSLADIAAHLAARYEVSVEGALRDVLRLAEELVRERLVSTADGAPPRSVAPTPDVRAPYEPPLLAVYRDMGDLLALDPPAPGLKDIPWKKTPDDESA